VDLSGGDLAAVRTIINLLKQGHRTVIFPEGTRSLSGQIQQARPGIGMIIAKTLAPVVPMRIFGSFQAWPKGGKIKPYPVTVVVGKPIRFKKEDLGAKNREAYQKISEQVLATIAAIEKPR
jgi:1-acyl-sn-glycerol-3-phosphate acyltransferase